MVRIERQIELEARLSENLKSRNEDGIDVSDLTPEEVQQRLEIVRETEAKLEALRKAKRPSSLIEVPGGSVAVAKTVC